MNLRWLFFLTIILSSSPSIAGSDADLILRSVEGERLLMLRDYVAGQALFEKLSEDYPESPAGAFGLMAMWQTRMFENRDFRFVSQYDAAEKKMDALCEVQLQGSRQPHSGVEGEAPTALPAEGALPAPIINRPSDWDMFVCASGYGMKGFFDGRRENWLQGMGGAIKSIRTYKRLLWLNPNFVDAEMGVGMYEFWRSVVTQRFKWLPFFSDRRPAGLAKVSRVTREGKYVRDLARANLVYMQAEMKQYDAALAVLNEIIPRYPRNVLLRQSKGEIFWWQKKYQDCYDVFAQILEEDPQMTRSLYWMAASSVMPYLKVGVNEAPKPDARLPEDVASRANGQLSQYLQSKPIKVWASAAHYWLALIAEWQNDKATAITEYNQALKLDPSAAKEIRKRLERLQK